MNLQEIFKYLNNLLFDGELPPIEIKYVKDKNNGASYKVKGYRSKSVPNVIDNIIEQGIYISNYWNFSEKQLKEILAHELIHYYINHKKLRDNNSHGVTFNRILNDLNNKQSEINIPLNHDTINHELKNKIKYGIILFRTKNNFYFKPFKLKSFKEDLNIKWLKNLNYIFNQLKKETILTAYTGITESQIGIQYIHATKYNKNLYYSLDEIEYNNLLNSLEIKNEITDISPVRAILENNKKYYEIRKKYDEDDEKFIYNIYLDKIHLGYLTASIITSYDELFYFLKDDIMNEFEIDKLIEKLGFKYNDRIIVIEYMEIFEKYKNNGVAKYLLNEFINDTKNKYNLFLLNACPFGINKIKLEYLVNFYKKLGFKSLIKYQVNEIMYLKF